MRRGEQIAVDGRINKRTRMSCSPRPTTPVIAYFTRLRPSRSATISAVRRNGTLTARLNYRNGHGEWPTRSSKATQEAMIRPVSCMLSRHLR